MTVTGTVTNADGSPGAGTVQLYVSMPLSLTTMHSNQTSSSCQALMHCSCPPPSRIWLSERACWPAMAGMLMQQRAPRRALHGSTLLA